MTIPTNNTNHKQNINNTPEKIIRNYLLSESTEEEINSYYEYLGGNKEKTDWIEKANEKREPLLNIRCSECIENINVFETGVCRCPNGHFGYNNILEKLELIEVNEQI